MLTEWQRTRVKFYLDQSRDDGDFWDVVENVRLSRLDLSQEMMLTGFLTDIPGAILGPINPDDMPDIITISGLPVATPESILGRLEVAFWKLTLQEESTYVIKAGNVQLNPAEGKLREKYFESRLEELYQFLGKPSRHGRVGW